jgi:Phage gp6-like head-tail connector protein
MRLVLVTPPAVEPVTLVDAKLHARIEFPDDDALVTSLITAARRYCETAIRAALVTQTWKLMLDSFPSAGGYYNRAIREIWPSLGGLPSGLGFYPGLIPNSTGVIDVPLPPLQDGTATLGSQVLVQYYDFQGVLQTVPATSYNVSLGTPGRIQPQYSKVWPIARPTIDCVQITFVAGQSSDGTTVSENVKTAIKMLTSYWYENRDDASKWGAVPVWVDALLSPDEPGIYA